MPDLSWLLLLLPLALVLVGGLVTAVVVLFAWSVLVEHRLPRRPARLRAPEPR